MALAAVSRVFLIVLQKPPRLSGSRAIQFFVLPVAATH